MDRSQQRLEKLRQKKDRIARQMAQIQATQDKKDRALDTRRKVIVGAMVLHESQVGAIDPEDLRKRLDRYLTRNHDRALFDLPLSDDAPQPVRSRESTA